MSVLNGGANGEGGRRRGRFAVLVGVLALLACLAVAPSALAAGSAKASIAKLGDVGYVVTVTNTSEEYSQLVTMTANKPFVEGSEGFEAARIVGSSGCKFGMPIAGAIDCGGVVPNGSIYVCYTGPAVSSISILFSSSPAPVTIAPTQAPEVHSCPVSGFVPPSGVTGPANDHGKPTKKKHGKHKKKHGGHKKPPPHVKP